MMKSFESLGEEMKEMRQRLGGGLPLLSRGVPFGTQVLVEELPHYLCTPSIAEYDGSADPMEHLGKLENSKRSTANFDNLLARAEKYVNMGEAARMKEAEVKEANKERKVAGPTLKRWHLST
ncbi:hypothetical protein BUALT_Bualt07G0069800 [Buddleja alternifolia]|uniref:Uncharacterized protein n=1 Tax=Buddleja alternifolia TaxID=168488 RepID=A0AAV6XFD4_9LAMI|nr:hypothetical protein BUALT_Bualt07G0069800 [Buddleja alternifolia]